MSMRVAVGLSGLIRTFDQTVDSFKKRVVDVHGADVFVFAPRVTDAPDRHHAGRLDAQGKLVHDSKDNLIGDVRPATLGRAEAVLGPALKACEMYEFSADRFAWAERIAPEELIFSIRPARFCSMFFNLQGVCRMIRAAEERGNFRYDYVILSRPDLAYFKNLTFENFAQGRVLIPKGSGVSNWKGFRNHKNAPVFFYQNIARGVCTPGLTHEMNDQIMVCHRDDLDLFEKFYDELPTLFADRVPLNPESMLFTWLNGYNDLEVVIRPEWFYTIHREGMPTLRNFTDLPNIGELDPSNLRALAYAKQFPLKVRLRSLRTRVLMFLDRLRGVA